MRKVRIKKTEFDKMRKLIKTVFNDGVTKGKYARNAKKYFAGVIINSL